MIIIFLLVCLAQGLYSSSLKIYALKYGQSYFQNRFIYYKDKSKKKSKFHWLFYYLEYQKGKILIDTGFESKKYQKMFGVKFKHPIKVLKMLNVNPEQITDIIITHSHFDHIENIKYFKNANIIIQKDELKKYLKKKSSYFIKKQLEKGKVFTFNQQYKLYELIIINKVGGHTKGSSVVKINYKNKNYLFVGDECYFRKGCMNEMASGSYFNFKKNINFLKSLKNEGNLVIFPFHDPIIVGEQNWYKQVIPE